MYSTLPHPAPQAQAGETIDVFHIDAFYRMGATEMPAKMASLVVLWLVNRACLHNFVVTDTRRQVTAR